MSRCPRALPFASSHRSLIHALCHSQWPEPPRFVHATAPARRRLKGHRPRTIQPLGRYGGARAIRDSPPDVAACHRAVVRRHTCCPPVTRRPTRATQARVAPGVHVCQPAPKAPSRESHETRNRPEDFLMVAQSTPSQARFATACYGLIVCVCYLFVKFCVTFLMMMMN